ncbi:hypothetical protein ACSBR2_038227 [Camellia fascicularis]
MRCSVLLGSHVTYPKHRGYNSKLSSNLRHRLEPEGMNMQAPASSHKLLLLLQFFMTGLLSLTAGLVLFDLLLGSWKNNQSWDDMLPLFFPSWVCWMTYLSACCDTFKK